MQEWVGKGPRVTTGSRLPSFSSRARDYVSSPDLQLMQRSFISKARDDVSGDTGGGEGGKPERIREFKNSLKESGPEGGGLNPDSNQAGGNMVSSPQS